MLNGYNLYRDRIPGIDRTIGAGGDSPHQSIRGYTVTMDKKLYFSPREIALLLECSVRSGYGVLEQGTVMAIDQNDTDLLVPYTPDTIAITDISRVFFLTDLTAAASFYVEMFESYKLAVGDTVVLTDEDGTYEDAVILTIDQSTYDNKALVTLTGACSGTYTVAKLANVYVKASSSADGTKASKAVCILDISIDTGAGVTAVGALGSLMLSNATLYKTGLVFMDDQAITDLGNVTAWGMFYIFK